jgi:hypothetical protein
LWTTMEAFDTRLFGQRLLLTFDKIKLPYNREARESVK